MIPQENAAAVPLCATEEEPRTESTESRASTGDAVGGPEDAQAMLLRLHLPRRLFGKRKLKQALQDAEASFEKAFHCDCDPSQGWHRILVRRKLLLHLFAHRGDSDLAVAEDWSKRYVKAATRITSEIVDLLDAMRHPESWYDPASWEFTRPPRRRAAQDFFLGYLIAAMGKQDKDQPPAARATFAQLVADRQEEARASS